MSTLQSNSIISPFLWFDSNAEEAVDFYVSVFPNSRRLTALRNPGEAPGPKGGVMVVAFELDGLKFSECLPRDLAAQVIQARLTDSEGVSAALGRPTRIVTSN